jgi:1-acyl-sn-glycerol-3-phosphate acyltransferase
MHIVPVVAWGVLLLCISAAHLLRSVSGRKMLILWGFVCFQPAVVLALFFVGQLSVLRTVSTVLLLLNSAILCLLIPATCRRVSSSYLWGGIWSILTTPLNIRCANRKDLPLIKRLFTPLVRRLWIAKVEGLDNIPGSGAYLVALNHESYFDFICFTAAIDRKIHYLAAEKFFEHPLWKRAMNAMDCIRVDRCSRVNRTAIKQISDVIAKERLVGIFPEGTRSPDGRLMRGKPGIAYLALHTGIPVIPVGLIGTFEIMSRYDRFPRLRKAEIRIGKPLSFASSEGEKPNPFQMQQITDEIMLKIAELTGEAYPCMEADNG